MGMAAAHFHDAVMAFWVSQPPDLFRSPGDDLWLAKFVNKFHILPFVLVSLGCFTTPLCSDIFDAISFDLLHGGFCLPEHSQRPHLVERILLTDLAHGKTDVDKNPIAFNRQAILQESQIHFAAHADDVNHGAVRLVGKKLDHLSRNG
jgi:hypothetical protein